MFCACWGNVDDDYTRRQINLYHMFFADFTVNSQPILTKFCKDYLCHAATAVEFSSKILYSSKARPFDM